MSVAKVPPGRRKPRRLSPDQRWQVGADCADLARKRGEEGARTGLDKRSKHARYIRAELEKVEESVKQGTPRHEAGQLHKERMEKLTRPNVKRLYTLPLKFNKSTVVKEVSRKWLRKNYQASEMTVRRCWKEFNELEESVVQGIQGEIA